MEVYLWPDGDYHCSEDGEPPSWKSDDYFILEVPDDIDDLDDWVYEQHLAVNLGESCERARSSQNRN